MIGDSPDTDPTFLGLLQAVCTVPDDDTPRLVLADWWEEHGQPERAEFVRIQCELAAAVPPVGIKDRPADLLGGTGRVFHKWGRKSAWGKRQAFLRRRERELLGANQPTNLCFNHTAWAGRTGRLVLRPGNPPMPYQFSRGFVSAIACTAADWLANADALAWHSDHSTAVCPPTAQPITRVVLTTRPEMTGWHDRGPVVQFGFGYEDRTQPSWTLAELGVPAEAQYDEIATAACNAKWPWPWITFEVNTGNTTTQPWQPEVART